MRRARPAEADDDELEESIERAAKRARIDAEGTVDAETLFGELLLHFTELGPAFSYADWSRLTQLKKKFSGMGYGGEVYMAGWRAMCFRDFRSVVRTRDGRGPYQFLLNLEAHFVRRRLELPPGASASGSWLRGYWRRAYVVCGHFVREILNECGASPFVAERGAYELTIVVHGVLADYLWNHTPDADSLVHNSINIGYAQALPVKMATRGESDADAIPVVLKIDVNVGEQPRVQDGADLLGVYDPLVTVDEEGIDYTAKELRGTSLVLKDELRGIRLEIPFGGPLRWRPILWNGLAVAAGTLDVTVQDPFYFPILSIGAIDVELFWAMVFTDNDGDNAFPAELLAQLPAEWKTREFEYTRLFMRGKNPAGLEIVVRDMYMTTDTDSINSREFVRLFCAVPDYNVFWNAVPDKGVAWLAEFDRIIMIERDRDVFREDPLRNARNQLVIYKCRRCADPAAYAILETGEPLCAVCAQSR